MVEEDTDILEAEKPGRGRATRGIHDLVDPALGSTPEFFGLVLVLIIGLRLIISNKEGSEKVSDLLGDFIGSSITDKGVHGSPIPDIISQGVDELHGTFDAIGITVQCISATQKLGNDGAICNGRSIREDCVSCNSFISPRDVEDRISGFKMHLEIVLGGSSRTIPGGDLEGVLNGRDGCPAKVGLEGCPVNIRGKGVVG